MKTSIKNLTRILIILSALFVFNVSSENCDTDLFLNNIQAGEQCLSYVELMKDASINLLSDYKDLIQQDKSLSCVLAVRSAITSKLEKFFKFVGKSELNILSEHSEYISYVQLKLKQDESKCNDEFSRFNWEKIIEAIRSGDHTKAKHSFDKFNLSLNETIVKTYEKNGIHSDKILDFLDTFEDVKIRIQGYRILFDEMLENEDVYNIATMTIAYRTSNYFDETDDVRYINENLPLHIKNFPWFHEVQIENNYPSYLYATTFTDSNRRKVYYKTNINASKSDCGSSCIWKIIPIDNGKYFQLTTLDNTEHLYAEFNNFKYDSDRRHIFTKLNHDVGEQSKWQFQPVRDKKYFRIKNKFWNEFLYAGFYFKYDENDTRVFTFRASGCEGYECYWKFVSQK